MSTVFLCVLGVLSDLSSNLVRNAQHFKQMVEEKTFLGNLSKEQEKFIREKRSEKKQEENVLPPWSGHVDEEHVKEEVLKLSQVNQINQFSFSLIGKKLLFCSPIGRKKFSAKSAFRRRFSVRNVEFFLFGIFSLRKRRKTPPNEISTCSKTVKKTNFLLEKKNLEIFFFISELPRRFFGEIIFIASI